MKKLLLLLATTLFLGSASLLEAQCYGTVLFDAAVNANGSNTFSITTTHPNELIMISYDGWQGPGSGPVKVDGNNATYINTAFVYYYAVAETYAYFAAVAGVHNIVCTEAPYSSPYYMNSAASFYTTCATANLSIASLTNAQNTVTCVGGGTVTATINTTIPGSMIYDNFDCNNGQCCGFTDSWTGATFLNQLHEGNGIDQSEAYTTATVPGSYTISANCSASPFPCGGLALLVVVIPPPICSNVTLTTSVVSNVKCNGGATGSANVVAAGGTPPYTYSWSTVPVQTTATATGLSAGCYTVTVQDQSGCSTTASICITQPPLLTAAITVNSQPTCGSSNGSVTVTAGGGTAPYTYLWNPGGNTNANATGLSAGNYTVTVTDNNGCIKTASVSLTSTAITVNATPTSNVTCNGNCNGTATATVVGGTAPFTYAWTPTGGSNATGTGLCAGNYTVTVTDNHGCTATASVAITQPPLLTATMGAPINPACNGQTGSATVTAGGGTAPYTYAWAPSGGNAATANVTAGSYTVTVTDNHGCIATASVTITQPTPVTATMGVPTDPACNGQTGSATVTAGGGTPNYTYLWAPSGGTNATGTGLTAGSYTVTVKDANGCIATASVTITQPAPLGTITSSTQASCNLSNGSVSVVVAGGATPYTYLWNPSAQTTAIVSNLSAGCYTVTVHDNNGCSATASVCITQPTAVTATMGATTYPLCNGGTGTATVNVVGGSVPYTYSWSTVPPQTNASATGLTAGSYTVTVTDNNGCISTASVNITQPTPVTATMDVPTYPLCNGLTGTLTVTAGGGTPNYTYAWAPAGGNAATANVTAGSYTVTVTDANGCTATASATITQPTPVTAAMGVPTTILCNGGTASVTVTAGGGTPNYTYVWNPSGGSNATATLSAGSYTVTVIDVNGCAATASVSIIQPAPLGATMSFTQASCNLPNGSAIVNPTGGTGPYAYLWNPSGQTTDTASALVSGSYTVTVTDNNGCTVTASIAVTQPSAVTASIVTWAGVSCNGGTNGTATANGNGGTGPYGYVWTPSGNTNAVGTGLSAGTYTMTVTDANGCSSTTAVTITQPTVLTAAMGAPTNILCNGGTASVTVTAGGGTPNYTYTWAPSGGIGATGTGLTAGSYTVIVKDANGCVATASVNIAQPTLLTAAISASANVPCNGGTGSASVTAGGGIPNYTYSWAPAGGIASTATLTAGSYTVTVKDANGCVATASVNITQPLTLTATMGAPNNILCNGGTGSATVAAGGGTPNYAYSWAPLGGTNATGTGLTPGSYTVTVTDTHGCLATASVTVTEPAPLSVAATGPQIDCSGAPVTLTATPSGGTLPYAYSWSPAGGNASTATVTPAATTTYTITITDAHGCIATAGITVNVKAPLSLAVTGDTLICSGGRVILTATASGGDGIYSYLWLPSNLTTQTVIFSPAHDTLVTVEVTDGCGSNMVSLTVPVTIQVLPRIILSADVYSGCAPLCIQFRDLSYNPEIAQYVWSFGNGDTTFTQSPIYCYHDTGKYSVNLTQTSTIGCSNTLQVDNMIKVYPPPMANFTYAPQPINILNSEVQFTDLSRGQYPLIEWNWRFGQGDSVSSLQNPSHYYPDTGTFCATLTVMDIHGCIDSVTNCLIVSPDFAFYIPDAFSPNGDGINDVFMPKGSYVKNYEMYVFDRWGMKIFHTNDITNGWNGTVNGGSNIAQEDTYIYLIHVTDSEGIDHSYTGRVSLIK